MPTGTATRLALASERQRLVAESSAVRRRALAALIGMTVVLITGATVIGILLESGQRVSKLNSLTERYATSIERVESQAAFFVDDRFRASVPTELLAAYAAEFDVLFEDTQTLSTQIDALVQQLRHTPFRQTGFASMGALAEYERNVVDPDLLETAFALPDRLLDDRALQLTTREQFLGSAIDSGEFIGPARHREMLTQEIVDGGRERLRQLSFRLAVITFGALAVMWVGGFRPSMAALRDLTAALDHHASEVEHGYVRLAAAQQVARLGYWLKPGNSSQLLCSPELVAMLEADEEPTTLAALAAITDGPAGADSLGAYEKLAQRSGTAEFTHTIKRPGRDELTLRERVESFETHGGVEVVGVMLDVSESMTAQQVIHRMERFEIIDLLISGIAHDFNNLLAIIIGNTELALDEPAPHSERQHQQLTAILNASRAAAALIEQLRRSTLEPTTVAEEFAPTDAITRVLQSMQSPDGVVVTTNFTDRAADALVLANRGVFESSIVNLVKNAFEANLDQGGEVTVSVQIVERQASTPAADPTHRVAPEVESVQVTISDSGVGMSERVRQRAMQPFFTTKSGRSDHAGLGLWSVFAFAKAWNGTLTIDSIEGRGTTVTMLLPTAGAMSKARAIDAAMPALTVDGVVLFVEDLDEMREVGIVIMERWGLDVIGCADFQTARDILETRSDIALLVSDVRLGVDAAGFTLAQIAGARQPPLPTVLISGAIATEETLTDLHTPSCVFLPKPFSVAELHRSIETVLNHTKALRIEPGSIRNP